MVICFFAGFSYSVLMCPRFAVYLQVLKMKLLRCVHVEDKPVLYIIKTTRLYI